MIVRNSWFRTIGFAGTGLLVIGCANSGSIVSPPDFQELLQQHVRHVVVIVQENRSFDNLFGTFPGADGATSGSNYGQIVPLTSAPLESGPDLDHYHTGWWADWDNGRNDGFAHPYTTNPGLFPYTYVPQSEIQPYWTLAREFVLADRMFQSNTGPSYVAHQYIIAGQSADADELPTGGGFNGAWGCDSPPGTTVSVVGPNGTDLPGPFPCFDYQTMADLLDQAHVSWKYYAPTMGQDKGFIWSAYDAIKHIRYGPDWAGDVISPETQVLSDIETRQLAQVSWVMPSWANSDHPNTNSNSGPDWVASIVNEIMTSPYWQDTVIFITWDDWGGFYDHVPPPQIDSMGLGFRVPLILVSPYAKRGYISHQQHEFGSILNFTEKLYGLPSLGTRDAVSDDFQDCFDFSQIVQPGAPLNARHSTQYFKDQLPSGPPDTD